MARVQLNRALSKPTPYFAQFTNRRQKSFEDLAALGSDIERLSRLAYPECTKKVRDKIACAQFIAALTDSFL